MSDKEQSIIEQLQDRIDVVQWKELQVHSARDALILVATDLDLLTVAAKISIDDATVVQGWMGEQKLWKPTADELAAWEAQPEIEFLCTIVQPFVLAQIKGTSQ